MKVEDFLEAIKIISKKHSTKLEINHVEPNGQVSKFLESPTISITDCCASVINELKDAGYSLSMKDGKTILNRY